MKISYLIFLGFLFILLLFSFTTYINYQQSEKVRDNAEYVSRSQTIIRQSSRYQRNLLNMVSGLRGYLLAEESDFLQAYDSASSENERLVAELTSIIPDTSFQKQTLNEILDLNHQWVNEFAVPLIDAKKLAVRNPMALANFNKLYKEKLTSGNERVLQLNLQDKFREFANYEYATRDQKTEMLAKSIQQTKNISFYLTALSVITGLLVAGFLTHRISTRLNGMVTMANSIAEGNYQVHLNDNGKDELHELAHSLNHMAKVLSENISLLQRKNEELDQFAHIVSHDLKAPLRGIDNVVSWIEEDHQQELSPKVDEYLQLIKGRIKRSENLIQGILSYARVGKEVQHKELVNLKEMINEIRDNIPDHQAINWKISETLPQIFTEKIPLSQVFANLVGNAAKYHDKPHGEISIYHKENENAYEFFVEDNGPGIDKNYHRKIFVIFQTLQERDAFESTGVGLAIVKKILDARKEHIHIYSEPGKGSVFSFSWSKF